MVEFVHEHKGFDDAAATWDDDPGHEKRQVAVAEAIEEAVDLSPGMKAVEVGGGTGRLSILLAGLVGSVVVTDPSAGNGAGRT
jgi:ubiquinone/menaquinone biosynthesis C-methylase UbiE